MDTKSFENKKIPHSKSVSKFDQKMFSSYPITTDKSTSHIPEMCKNTEYCSRLYLVVDVQGLGHEGYEEVKRSRGDGVGNARVDVHVVPGKVLILLQLHAETVHCVLRNKHNKVMCAHITYPKTAIQLVHSV